MREAVQKMIEEMNKLDNGARLEYLKWLYDNHFNPYDSEEERIRAIGILEMYERGELVRVEENDDC